MKIGGIAYETVIDEHGTQRFRTNPNHPLVRKLAPPRGTGARDLNAMAAAYHRGEFTQRDYAEMNMAIGYSVSGFAELSDFHDMLIENPLWEAEDGTPSDPRTDDWLRASLLNGTLTLSEAIAVLMERDGIGRAEAERGFVDRFLA